MILEPRKIKSVTVSIVFPTICNEVMPPNLSTLIPPLFQFGYKVKLNKQGSEKSLEVQWLGLGDFTAKDPGSQVWCSQKKKKKKKLQGLDLRLISSTFSSNQKSIPIIKV